MTDTRSRSVFTIRFGDQTTHDCLRFVARERGVSMNQLAEEFIQRELGTAILGLEVELSTTLEALQAYRAQNSDDDWAAYAEAEVDVDDPVDTRQLGITAMTDPFGVASAFGRTRVG
ncbi:MAG: hypothetical protein ACRDQZ_09780 [Mycobacteriales bacterium]